MSFLLPLLITLARDRNACLRQLMSPGLQFISEIKPRFDPFSPISLANLFVSSSGYLPLIVYLGTQPSSNVKRERERGEERGCIADI